MNTSTSGTTTPSIWVGCLASYNAGTLHGEWLDATDGYDSVMEQIGEILKTSPEPNAEEWHICDHEGFGKLAPERYDAIEGVCKIAEAIDKWGDVYEAACDVLYGTDTDPDSLDDCIYSTGYSRNPNSYMSAKAQWAYDQCEQIYGEDAVRFFGHAVDWDDIADQLTRDDSRHFFDSDDGNLYIIDCDQYC